MLLWRWKKYKKCCINKNANYDSDKFNLIDEFVCKAEWYLKRQENKLYERYEGLGSIYMIN